MKRRIMTVAVLFLLGAVGCKTAKTSSNTIDITNQKWELIEMNGFPVVMKVPGAKLPYMRLSAGDLRVSGNGGCNGFGGIYSLQANGRIHFSQMISTQMACSEMDTETAFFKVLNTADNYTVKGDTLSLNKGRMAPLAKFVTASQ